MEDRQLIAILRGVTPDEVLPVCQSLVDAGITMIEVPLNSPNAIESIGRAVSRFNHSAKIGAGTVLAVEEVDAVAGTGARFVVSPDCNDEIIKRTLVRRMQSFPGVFTPTEAFRAARLGSDGLKFFPAGILGPEGIKAMKAVLPPELPVYAVGGANPDNFSEYFAAGCAGFGLGSYLYKPGKSPSEIAELARRAVEAYDTGKPQ
jgi:2-dehydro-3-deoxyphosphogalactonate aldolase